VRLLQPIALGHAHSHQLIVPHHQRLKMLLLGAGQLEHPKGSRRASGAVVKLRGHQRLWRVSMSVSWFHRIALALACASSAALLTACGSGSVVSDLNPTRFITAGEGFADVGQKGYRFTINDGTPNWVQQLAANYGQTLTAASTGGWGYAQGFARVNSDDATSGTNAPSVKAQIDTLLARLGSAGFDKQGDVMMINGGMADIVEAVKATGISAATTQTVKAAGTALGEQVRRLVNAGATHVVVTGVYNLGNTPWGEGLNQVSAINDLSTTFNDALKVDIVDLGNNVLFFDSALFFNLIYNNDNNDYSLDNSRNPVCITPDATTCTLSTLVAGADSTRWLFADNLHFTPTIQRMFVSESYAENVYYKFEQRW
jgi:phospholipase/lecithinase/hemolysin